MHTLDAKDIVHAIAFSPLRYWVCAAAGSAVKVWNLEGSNVDVPKFTLTDPKDNKKADCISLTWSADGKTLYAGYTDNRIRVWRVTIVPIPPPTSKDDKKQKKMED